MSTRSKVKNVFNKTSKELQAFARDIEKHIPAYEVEKILSDEAQPMLDNAKSRLRSVVKSNEMVSALKIFKGEMNYHILIGPDWNYYKAFLFTMYEYGTVERYRRYKKKGSTGGKTVYAGAIAAQPFMRPAFEQFQKKVFDGAAKQINKLAAETLQKYITK
jgi:hypothetical protein